MTINSVSHLFTRLILILSLKSLSIDSTTELGTIPARRPSTPAPQGRTQRHSPTAVSGTRSEAANSRPAPQPAIGFADVVHISILEATHSGRWGETRNVYCVPPRDGWSKRTYQQNGEPVPSISRHEKSGRLGASAPASPFRNHEHDHRLDKILSLPTPHRKIPTPHSPTHESGEEGRRNRCRQVDGKDADGRGGS